MTITNTQNTANTVVIQQAVTTNEWIVVEIHENVREGWVRAEVEFGPFNTRTIGQNNVEAKFGLNRKIGRAHV